MTKTDISRPTILELLDQFEEEFLPTAKAGTRKRFSLIRRHLRTFLDDEAEDYLIEPSLSTLYLERAIDPVGAYERVLHADDLFYALPVYLAPDRALPDSLNRTAQLDLISQLCQWLSDKRYINKHNVDECAMLDVNSALLHGREALAAQAWAARPR